MKTLEFKGSWAGLPVAWKKDDTFDEATYRKDIAACAEVGVPGVYCGGTTGEFYTQTWEEFQEISFATVEEAHKNDMPAMVGVAAMDTRQAVRKAEYAARIGADAIQVTFPFWLEIRDREILPFAKEVSEASGSLPFSLYETARCKKHLSLSQHLELKQALPNYAMVKATVQSADTLTPEGCSTLTQNGIAVFADESSQWVRLFDYGIQGCCSALVYYAPKIVMPMNEALLSRDLVTLKKHAVRLEQLMAYLVEQFIIQREMYDSAIDRMGGGAIGILSSSLHCRKPYRSASSEDAAMLRQWWESDFVEYVIDRERPF